MRSCFCSFCCSGFCANSDEYNHLKSFPKRREEGAHLNKGKDGKAGGWTEIKMRLPCVVLPI